MILKLKRTPCIYLVGFMGCGKTTVGRLLAKELGWPFADLDHDIEHSAGCSINEIFDQQGETEFRRIEHDALSKRVKRVQTGFPLVLSLGGGTFAQPGNMDLILNNGVSVWLDCTPEIVEARLRHSTHRPLARDPQKLRELYHKRRELYAKADYHIPIVVDDSELAAQQVLRLPIYK